MLAGARKAARRFALVLGEYFAQAAGFELRIGALAPIVEIARDDHRCVVGQLRQALHE